MATVYRVLETRTSINEAEDELTLLSLLELNTDGVISQQWFNTTMDPEAGADADLITYWDVVSGGTAFDAP